MNVVRRAFRDLLARGFLIEVAAAIALALALLDFVQAVSGAIVTFATTEFSGEPDALGLAHWFGDRLTFSVAGHPLMLAPVVSTSLTLLVVLAIVLLLLRRVPREE